MANCDSCNKKIGEEDLTIDTKGETICSDCLIKNNNWLILIQKFTNEGQYDTARIMSQEIINKINLVSNENRDEFLIFAYTSEGISNMALGNYLNAAKSFGKALEINPKNIEILHKLAATYLLNNKKNKALIIFDKILSINPKDETAINMKNIHS